MADHGIQIVGGALVVMLMIQVARAQSADEKIDAQEISDELLAGIDDGLDHEAVFEHTMQSLSSRVDLNTATAEDLKALGFLSEVQITDLLSWRVAQGPFLEIYELQVVPGIDRETIAKLEPFVAVVAPRTRQTSRTGYLVTRFERTLEKKKGFRSTEDGKAFEGSADRLYLRFRSSEPGSFSIGFTGEKDDGERMRIDPKNRYWGFDFTSFHLQLRNKGILQNLVLGDFQAQFAQGLLFGGAFGIGKGGEQIVAVRKAATGFRPYTSVHESAYRRGIAATLRVTPVIGLSAFYSIAKRDASDVGEDSTTVYALQATGLHRTASELFRRQKLREQNAGLVLRWHKHTVDAGVLLNYIVFSEAIGRKPAVYNTHSFSGSRNTNAGAFLNCQIGNISFFGEAGKTLDGGMGGVAGILVSPHAALDIAMLYRYYSRDFQSLLSSAFSEGAQPNNERGMYWAWKYRWNRRLGLNGYADLFRFPWIGFRRYKPSSGFEWFLRGSYQPSRDVNIILQIREESKASNLAGPLTVYKVGDRRRVNVSTQLDYGINKHIRLKSRVQYNSQLLDDMKTEGWAFIQDCSAQVGRFMLAGRHALFDTDHYDNRHYAYERDTWSAYSMPAYSGVGVRNYALIEYKFSKKLTLWIRYARTRMLSGGEIGSGQDAIEGNTRNDVKFQARWAF